MVCLGQVQRTGTNSNIKRYIHKGERKGVSAYVQCVMTYSSETRPMSVGDMRCQERAEKMVIRWMCAVTLRNGKTSEEIKNRLGIVSECDMVHQVMGD
jgi:hypothetical protein